MIYLFNDEDHMKLYGYNLGREPYDQNLKTIREWYDRAKMIKVFITQHTFDERKINKHDLRIWLTENCKFDVIVAPTKAERFYSAVYEFNDNGYLFYFDNANDAMLFKLRWL